MKHPVSRRVLRLALYALALSPFGGLFLQPASADDANYDGDWHFTLTPYGWLTNITGALNFDVPPKASGVTAHVDFDEGVFDLIPKLHFVISGEARVRKGEWSAFTDMMYVSLGGSKTAVRTVTGPLGVVEIPVNLGTSIDIKNFIATNAIGYSVHHQDETEADIFAGFRYAGMWTDLHWRFSGPIGLLPQTGTASANKDVWDGIVGIRGRHSFTGTPWFIPFYADVGAGTSDLTAQASVGAGYEFRWGEASASYRYLYYKPGGTVDHLSLHGVVLAASFHI